MQALYMCVCVCVCVCMQAQEVVLLERVQADAHLATYADVCSSMRRRRRQCCWSECRQTQSWGVALPGGVSSFYLRGMTRCTMFRGAGI